MPTLGITTLTLTTTNVISWSAAAVINKPKQAVTNV